MPEYIYRLEYIYTHVFFAHANWTLVSFSSAVLQTIDQNVLTKNSLLSFSPAVLQTIYQSDPRTLS